MPEIGATLREARMRARIDVSEIEAQTKIRAKYLRALENEEWGLLPGPTFVKSFLRTYATALGLDGRALVEEYRLHHERASEAFEPIVSTPRRQRARGGGRPISGPSRGYIAAVSVIGGVIVLLIVLLATGGGSSKSPSRTTATTTTSHSSTSHHRSSSTAAAPRPPAVVALSLKPSATVYVCLIGDHARKLIPGIELQAGESTATYHARHFLITLGNSSVTMYVDGRPRSVPPSSQAIGYSITKARGRQPLQSSELPTCK
ncbi:MAG TPA: helix-turn-helix domain-containing protein [Solirubrobacteraceae bacterium]|nr:helix-turn-helix domain-containing protein [Solirubrobacteraceae bacterium]